MVIRLRKIHFQAVLAVIITVLFVFAVKSEKTTAVQNVNNGRRLPIVMYHHITENKKKAGKYVILKKELKKDLEYIKKAGYTTVTVNDIIKYTEGKKQLPEKIIMITFDDGFKSIYKIGMPIFQKMEMKAVVSVIGSVTETYSSNGDENINYAYMTWDDIIKVKESGVFEIQNHSYDMHSTNSQGRKGLSRKSGESPISYKEILQDDLLRMQQLLKNQCGITATAVAYPYGAYSKETRHDVKEIGFKAALLCEERINYIVPGESEKLFSLGRFNRPSGISSKKFFEGIL